MGETLIKVGKYIGLGGIALAVLIAVGLVIHLSIDAFKEKEYFILLLFIILGILALSLEFVLIGIMIKKG